MKSAAGLIYRKGEFIEGSISLEKNGFIESQNPPENADVRGIILPRPVNCHTHVGDAFIKRPEKATVEELVAPPDGLKHRMLREVSQEMQVAAMREAISGMGPSSHFIDFREGGLEGVRRLLMASLGTGIRPVILGRPDSYDVNEMNALLSVADGIGMSAISDVDYDVLARISEHARSCEKIFAIHASEARQEDMSRILDLGPDLLVHLTMADNDDLAACSDAGVPAAVCPGSNSFFGMKPQIRNMLDAGMTVCLGTDNAMLASPDILGETRLLRRMFSESHLSNVELFSIAFDNGRKVLNSLPGLGEENGEHPEYFVLEVQTADPYRAVLDAGPEDVRLFERGEGQ